jgi:hypothetical protein
MRQSLTTKKSQVSPLRGNLVLAKVFLMQDWVAFRHLYK